MDFIVGLFWLGFILVLASIVFGLVLGAFGFVLVGIVGVFNWVWERLKK